MPRTLLFDLDDTLTVDLRAAEAAFISTAALAAARLPALDAAQLARDARSRARELWHDGPGYEYCRTIGMSSWEGLWCRFEGDGAPLPDLRTWSAGYRANTWGRALADQGIEDDALAVELGETFGHERRARHQTFADAREVLPALAERHTLGLITNGAPCLQREKLERSGLGPLFDVVVISGELGFGKPDPRVFACAIEKLSASASDSLMIGNSVKHDIVGAIEAGIGAVWVNRDGAGRADLPSGARELESLAQLPELLD